MLSPRLPLLTGILFFALGHQVVQTPGLTLWKALVVLPGAFVVAMVLPWGGAQTDAGRRASGMAMVFITAFVWGLLVYLGQRIARSYDRGGLPEDRPL